ncbi:hypothetical protein Pmani_014460 [Petrolisthes manimaculis]|uniref:Uncharacterized protein n=1 Tax=Petrolisthes manimaculis TaxID=1843537 RepID=A0AAE1PNC3_9EUCA|nr:hypothetical protein Pmani_017118 [Petrolisthes manimaculis]KAK4314216.1 hypothetical protein Pmani_014460 [Petrolisthes manimaculis]
MEACLLSGGFAGLRVAPSNEQRVAFVLPLLQLHIKYPTETPIISREEAARLMEVAGAETLINLEAIITLKV